MVFTEKPQTATTAVCATRLIKKHSRVYARPQLRRENVSVRIEGDRVMQRRKLIIAGDDSQIVQYNLTELYDSNQDQARDFVGGAVTFQAPLVVNGKVDVGAQDQLDVYGLLPQ